MSKCAFECWHKDCSSERVVSNDSSASQARYGMYLRMLDFYPDCRYIDIRSRKISKSTVRHEICDECDKGYPIQSHRDPTTVHKEADEWSVRNPIGTPVLYSEVVGVSEPILTQVASAAWNLCGTAVARLQHKSGGCSISHMVPVDFPLQIP